MLLLVSIFCGVMYIMHFKKIMVFVLCVLLLLSLAACGNSGENSADDNIITFTVSYRYPYFVNAVEEFNNTHKNVKVKMVDFNLTYNSTVESGSEKTQVDENEGKRVDLALDDYIKIVNSGLMSGGGYDIIKMSGLDYRKYIDKDMLVDFNELIENDKNFSQDSINKRIIDLLEYKGKLCIMPLNYYISPIIAADADVFEKLDINVDDRKWTWNDFYDIACRLAEAKSRS
jgi:multiple sugar transport system substrate-binding protein